MKLDSQRPVVPVAIRQMAKRILFPITRCGLTLMLYAAVSGLSANQLASQTLRAASDSAEAHNERGAALGDAGDFDGAIKEMEIAIHLRGDYADAYYNLGATYIRRAKLTGAAGGERYYQDLDRALTALRTALRLQSGQRNIHNLMGWLYQEIGDFHAATAEFRREIAAEPDLASAYNNLGSALVLERNFAEAVRAYEKAVELSPHFIAAHLNLASAIQQRGEPEVALKERQDAVREHPKSALAHALLGHAWLFNDRPNDARVELQKAIEIDSEMAIAHFYLGDALRQTGEMAAAREALATAIKLTPETAEFHRQLGAVLLQQDNVKQAVVELNLAVQQEPSDAAGHYLLAGALRKAGRAAEAQAEFQKTAALKKAKLDVEQAGLHTMNGIASLRAARIEDAVAELRKAVACKPDYAEGNYYLGIALAQSRNYVEAEQAFQAALARRPQSAEIHYNFGIALWSESRFTEAIREFRDAVKLNPEDALAFCALAKALQRQGSDREGQTALEKARQLGACSANAPP